MGAILDFCCNLDNAIVECCKDSVLSVGRLLKIEDLAKSAILEEDKVLTNLQGSAIIALMRESQ